MSARKHITYIISNIDQALAYEWIVSGIDRERIALSFILLNPKPSRLAQYLRQQQIPVHEVPFMGKKDIPQAVLRCRKLLKAIGSDAVHCHLFEASIVGLTAAKLAGIKQRIYTRHHSTFHHTYFPSAVKWDRYCNRQATDIVCISENVKQVLLEKERVPEKKLHRIYHGFDIDAFHRPDPQQTSALRAVYNPDGRKPVIGIISRFIELKGLQYAIPAFQKLLIQYPDALLLLFNAKGNYLGTVNGLLDELPEGSYKKTTFEPNISALYPIFDLFLHVPVNAQIEAFGQTYIESMAAGVPLIATRSGIGNEIMEHGVNALVVPYENSDAIYEAMLQVLREPGLKEKLSRNGYDTVKERFALAHMINELERLYLSHVI